MLKKKNLIPLFLNLILSSAIIPNCYAETSTDKQGNDSQKQTISVQMSDEEKLEILQKDRNERLSLLYSELETMSENDVLLICIDGRFDSFKNIDFFEIDKETQTVTPTIENVETLFFGFKVSEDKHWIGYVPKQEVLKLIELELATNKDLLKKEENEIKVSRFYQYISSPSGISKIPDYNGDSVTDLTDLTALSLYLIGDATWNDEQVKNFDCNADGSTNLADLAHLKQYIMGEDVKLG